MKQKWVTHFIMTKRMIYNVIRRIEIKVKLEIENDYGLFKANNNEEPDRLKIYDSDGKYMEYINVSDDIAEEMDGETLRYTI